MFRLIKILVLALLLPVSANANFHSGTEEEHERLSRLIMQYGEIIHSVGVKDSKGNYLSASYHVRVNKGSSNRMRLQVIPEGIYICMVAVTTGSDLDGRRSLFNCAKL